LPGAPSGGGAAESSAEAGRWPAARAGAAPQQTEQTACVSAARGPADDERARTQQVGVPGPFLLTPGDALCSLGGGELDSGGLSQSPSFCLETQKKMSGSLADQLTATDVFSRSKNFIKRPSTMMADGDDAMHQVAQALESSGQQSHQQQQQALPANVSLRRDRRQAIVPPKLVTDANLSGSDNEPEVGTLIDVAAEEAAEGEPSGRDDEEHFGADEEAALSTIRRKRSGGGIEKKSRATAEGSSAARPIGGRRRASTSTSFGNLAGSDNTQPPEDGEGAWQACPTPGPKSRPPALVVSPELGGQPVELEAERAASQACQPGQQQRYSRTGSPASPSLVSQSSASQHSGGSPTGPTCQLGVPLQSSASRRRSSIAVIPQMQICPGDLLVYSKQLIDRMNQSDSEQRENQPPQFLTIDPNDSKKGKNIWASFKLCAQFDNRTMRARNELLCSLEDVLASLKPSTFVDEQLSHYKGMNWTDFLFETESRRSASSDELNRIGAANANETAPSPARPRRSYRDELAEVAAGGVQLVVSGPSPGSEAAPAGERPTEPSPEGAQQARGGAGPGPHEPAAPRGTTPTRKPVVVSRFKEKPKLKRGQTVDSVFRIPLIPSSPLKHAQQHQQTPTAHLEGRVVGPLGTTMEDDERSSGSGSAGRADSLTERAESQARGEQAVHSSPAHQPLARHAKRSSSTRSRDALPGPSRASGHATPTREFAPRREGAHGSQESSFEADDAADLLAGGRATGGAAETGARAAAGQHQSRSSSRAATPNQIVRQSSLSTLASTITRTEQKRQRALWDLFQSECTFFFDHLMTLKNVYMEPLKKIQVEGFAMFADPDVLFGNLDELCCGVYDFCKEFLYIIMRTLKTRPEELNATDVLIKLYKKNPKIDHLRAVYHRYTLNYINALTYLESLRRQVEFVEFEKWSSRDARCKKLQLTDLLVAPVQHIMRVPIILKDIEAHTEHVRDRDEIRAILAVEEASLRELDDKMRWLKNFERLLEIQKNISWPSVLDMDPKLYIPEVSLMILYFLSLLIVEDGSFTLFNLGKKLALLKRKNRKSF